MTCRAAHKQLPSFLEGDLPDHGRRLLTRHLAGCSSCERHSADLRHSNFRLATSLRALPPVAMPGDLAMRLRVTASQERERNQGRGDFSTATRRWWTRAKLTMGDLMRPLALPAAGGLLSSMACFTMLASSLSFPQQEFLNDIPLGFTTQVQVDQLSPFGYTGRDVVIELTIDKNGQVANFAAHGSVTRNDMKELGNLILFTSFAPATAFGQPTSGKILLRSHRINVRG